jgi:hypothetical protein
MLEVALVQADKTWSVKHRKASKFVAQDFKRCTKTLAALTTLFYPSV